jgi:hypothetical protein
MRAFLPAFAVALLLVASGAAPAAVAGAPPVTVLQALPGGTPSPATGQEAVAVARGGVNVPSVLARPFKTELGWTAQWQGNAWWLVGVYESDWGTRFVVRATVEGRFAKFGVGPTRQWILDNAEPQVTTLYTRFDPASAVARMQTELLAFPPPDGPNQYPNYDPRNYAILDGAATLVRDEPDPAWWFVYYALDHRTGQNVVVPVTDAGYDPPVPEGLLSTDGGASVYGFWGVWPRNDVQPADPKLIDWVNSVIAARGWQPADWPSKGRDETFWSIPPFMSRPPAEVPRRPGGTTPSPATAKAAVAVAQANFDIPSVLAEPFLGGGGWTAQWRGKEWWLVAVFRSNWGKRFVVRATVSGDNVQFGAGPSKQWIHEHATPRPIRTLYTRLKPWSAASLLKAEMLAGPASRFDPKKYSILAGSAGLVRDAPPTAGSGPMWYAVYYATDLPTGRKVVVPVTSPSRGPLVEMAYAASTPGSTAYGFQGYRVLRTVPSSLSDWIRSVVAKRGWRPTNFH